MGRWRGAASSNAVCEQTLLKSAHRPPRLPGCSCWNRKVARLKTRHLPSRTFFGAPCPQFADCLRRVAGCCISDAMLVKQQLDEKAQRQAAGVCITGPPGLIRGKVCMVPSGDRPWRPGCQIGPGAVLFVCGHGLTLHATSNHVLSRRGTPCSGSRPDWTHNEPSHTRSDAGRRPGSQPPPIPHAGLLAQPQPPPHIECHLKECERINQNSASWRSWMLEGTARARPLEQWASFSNLWRRLLVSATCGGATEHSPESTDSSTAGWPGTGRFAPQFPLRQREFSGGGP